MFGFFYFLINIRMFWKYGLYFFKCKDEMEVRNNKEVFVVKCVVIFFVKCVCFKIVM